MASHTVLVVEDDESISESMAYHLGKAGFRVLRAGDGAQGLRLFRQHKPDLVIVDLMLPEVDGWRLTQEIRADDGRVPLVMCSARTSEYDRVHGLEVGADDYISKPFSMKELVARVGAHLRRSDRERQPAGRTAVELGPLRVDPDQVQAYCDDRSVGLTPREFEVLYALARNGGKPLTRDRLYRDVWGYEMAPGDRSVDVFVRKVRQKLAKSCAEQTFVQTHYGVGYRFEMVDRDSSADTDDSGD